jgi:hypothetical protein
MDKKRRESEQKCQMAEVVKCQTSIGVGHYRISLHDLNQ